MNFDPEHGADHLSDYDMERMSLLEALTAVWEGQDSEFGLGHVHSFVRSKFCRLCGLSEGLEAPA